MYALIYAYWVDATCFCCKRMIRLTEHRVALLLTYLTGVEPWSLGRDESWVCSELPYEHRKWTSGDVSLVELEVDIVDSILLRKEPTRVQLIVQFLNEKILDATRWRVDVTFQHSLNAVEVHGERRWLLHLTNTKPDGGRDTQTVIQPRTATHKHR